MVAEMHFLKQVYIHFLDGLPTVDWSLRRHHNRILREERGDSRRIAFVECLVSIPTDRFKLLGYLWIGRVFCWAKAGTAKQTVHPARAVIFIGLSLGVLELDCRPMTLLRALLRPVKAVSLRTGVSTAVGQRSLGCMRIARLALFDVN